MALRFDKIQTTNVENFSATTIVELDHSTYTILRNPEGSRSIYLGDSADRVNYYDNNAHRFRTAGGSSTQMFIDASSNVGIATTAPLQRFHVAGTAYFSGGTNVAFQSGGDTRSNTAITIDAGDKLTIRQGPYVRTLLWQDSSNSIIKIGETGTSLIKGINLESGHDGDASSAQVRVYGGSTEYVRFDGYNKKVGIGTTTPTEKLDVAGTYKLNGQRGLMVRSINESNYFSFNDESTTADFTQQLPYTGGGGSVAKVDDSTAPAPGCFEITGAYYSDMPTINRYVKIDINAEYTWEIYVKFISGTDTAQRIYLGWGAWDSSKTYFGNTQRYWGSVGTQVDADTNNTDWVLIRGSISGVGAATGQFISGTEYVAPVVLLNHGENTNVIRVCGLRLYKSSKDATKIQLGRVGSGSNATLAVNTEYPERRVTLENSGADGMRVTNDHGHLEIGCLNGDHAHIQTDRPKFYFNKRIVVNEGIISSYDENLTLQTSQSTRMTILNSNGHVGIGETSPHRLLHVRQTQNSTAVISGIHIQNYSSTANSSAGIVFENYDNPGAYIKSLRTGSSNGALAIGTNSGGGLAESNMVERVRIDHQGGVGIGVTSPYEKLHVNGKLYVNSGQVWDDTTQGTGRGSIHLDPNTTADHAGGAITWGASDASNGESAQAGIYVRSNGTYGTKMYFSTTNSYGAGSKTRMTILSTGTVGIGTTIPSARLHIATTDDTIIRLTKTGHREWGHLIDTSGHYYIRNITGSYNTLTLTDDNKVGIGTTIPAEKLEVNGGIKATGIIKAGGAVSVNNTSAMTVAHWSGLTNTTGAIKLTLPGSHSSNWSMVVLRITSYEYNSNNHTVYYASGHDWTNGWFNRGVTKLGDSEKNIQFGYDSNNDYIILGEAGSTWYYGHVTVDLIAHPSFYSSAMDISSGWSISQTTSLTSITLQTAHNRTAITTNGGSISKKSLDYTPLTVTKNGSNQFAFQFADAMNFVCNATGAWTFNPTVAATDVGKSGVITINNTGTTTPGALPSVFKTPNGDSIVFETDSGDTSIISYYVASTTKVLVNYVGNFS